MGSMISLKYNIISPIVKFKVKFNRTGRILSGRKVVTCSMGDIEMTPKPLLSMRTLASIVR